MTKGTRRKAFILAALSIIVVVAGTAMNWPAAASAQAGLDRLYGRGRAHISELRVAAAIQGSRSVKTIVFGALAVMLILASAASQAQEFPAAILEHVRFTYTAPNSDSDTGTVIYEYSPTTHA